MRVPKLYLYTDITFGELEYIVLTESGHTKQQGVEPDNNVEFKGEVALIEPSPLNKHINVIAVQCND